MILLETLENIFNTFLGLIALIFVYLFKLFFLVTSVISLVIIGYTFISCIHYMKGGLDVELAVCSTTVCLNMVYLYITVKLGVGMYDILMLVNRIVGFIKPKNPNDATAGGSNTVVGSKGVFKR